MNNDAEFEAGRETDRTDYTPEMFDKWLNGYLRNNPRPMPWPLLMKSMGTKNLKGVKDLRYEFMTSYTSTKLPDETHVRREYHPTKVREDRTGWPFYPREDEFIKGNLGGLGQNRTPKADIPHVARLVGRPEAEVAARWAILKPSDGFGFKTGTPKPRKQGRR